MPRLHRGKRSGAVAAETVETRASLRSELLLQRHDGSGAYIDAVDAIKAAADAATLRLQQLEAAVAACNANPTSRGVEAVEVEASAVRQELLKLGHLRNSVPRSNPAAFKIASTQVERVGKQYFDHLSALSATSDLQDGPEVAIGGVQGYAQNTSRQQQQIGDVLERNREIQQIESGVGRVNVMMQELQTIVLSDGERLDAIDDRIADAYGETQRAYVQIGKTQRLKAAIRRKKIMLGTVGALLLVGGIIVLIVVLL
jgi:hypothetical protein